MLAHTASEDDHPGLFGLDGHVVEAADVADNVDLQLKLGLVRVEVDHVPERAVGYRGTEDWDVVLE